MKLESFRVRNFRSVFDSGLITTELTAILGRNESGKTNLLLALKSLNPAEGFGKLNDIKDFPETEN
jgi:AAA15 family ATPase/GTPase